MGTEIWHMSDPPEGYFPVLWPCFIGCVMNKHLVSFYKNWSNSYSCVYFIWPTHWTPIQLTLADHARLPEFCLKYFHAFFLITSTHAPKFQWSHPDRIVSYSEYLLSAMWLGTRLQITSCTVGHLCKLHKLHTVEQHHQRRHVTAMALRLSPPLPVSPPLSVSLSSSLARTYPLRERTWLVENDTWADSRRYCRILIGFWRPCCSGGSPSAADLNRAFVYTCYVHRLVAPVSQTILQSRTDNTRGTKKQNVYV